MQSLADQMANDGYAVVRGVLCEDDIQRMRAGVERARQSDHPAAVANSAGVYGLRNLADVMPEITPLVASTEIRGLLERLFEQPAFLVRATLFDKTEGANWGVFWHQDHSIAVHQRIDAPGFDGWTKKAGVSCVRPPAEIMERMRTIRLHLDDCGEQQGALKVLPGTHRLQRLNSCEVESTAATREQVTCAAAAGDAVLMCPLILHASSPMQAGTSRRVIHLEFADFALPSPLEWYHANPWRKSA